jgi:dimeric dUTPase (all-alpha-NTP-PPase superfamily)
VTDRLQEIFDKQLEFNNMVRPVREFPNPDPAVLMAQLREQAFALILEIAEAVEKTSWKPWVSKIQDPPIPYGPYMKEMIDVFHFFINMCLLGGVTPEQLYEGYYRKNLINIARQKEGYDGVSTKCPGCNDALDDSTGCHLDKQMSKEEKTSLAWCALKGDWYSMDTRKHYMFADKLR